MSPYIHGVLVYPASHFCGVAVVIALTAILSGASAPSRRRGLLALVILMAGTIGGAALNDPSFRPTMGVRYPGAGIGALVALPLARRVLAGTSLLAFGDLVAAPLAFGVAVAMTCCFFHGCCFGLPSALPWAVTFPHLSQAWFHQLQAGLIAPAAERSLPVQPVQLYFVAWSICVGLLLLRLRSRKTHDGQLLWLFLFLHGVGWAFVEGFKAVPDRVLQVVMLVLALVSSAALVARMARARARHVQVV